MNIRVPTAGPTTYQQADYRVHVADSDSRCREVAGLINRMYSWRGYRFDADSGVVRRAGQTVFQVRRQDRLVATLTLRMDSELGLMADQLYRQEVDFFRGLGGKVCELTGLVVVPREDSRAVLGALFDSAHAIGRTEHGASDLVIEVNPRHVGYYQRRLGFRKVGPERTCPRVGAPAVLLHLDLDDTFGNRPEGVARCALPFSRRSC
jgi:hypothetical protein